MEILGAFLRSYYIIVYENRDLFIKFSADCELVKEGLLRRCAPRKDKGEVSLRDHPDEAKVKPKLNREAKQSPRPFISYVSENKDIFIVRVWRYDAMTICF